MFMQGLHVWFRANLTGRKAQRGFTLIELLVVVTILGILAGIVTLSLVGLTTHANVEACNSEYKTVQAALDSYMANNNLSTLPNGAQGVYTDDMTGSGGAHGGNVTLYNATPSQTSPNYTRNGTTQFFYEWDQFGKITATGASPVGNGIGSDNGGTSINGCQPK
jgi:prepilin-type N-terminal cleavage/methylation domain-containing protein